MRPFINMLNGAANGILRLLRIEPKDEVSSSYTREEVAALVEESRGEGMIAADEYDRLAGALGFTEKTVAAVLMPTGTLTTVRRGSSAARSASLNPSVCVCTSRWLIRHCLLSCTNSIGSSIVITWSCRERLM